jgi:stearoyl-CoA desaturase (delta-9 desaturase)
MSEASILNVRSSVPEQRRQPPGWTSIASWLGILPFVLLHVSCLAVWLTGTTALAVVLCGVLYLVRMFGITAGYHRYFAHRSYKTSRAFQFVLACLGCSALQKGPLWWVGHHRQHHLHADTPKDLHSPRTSSSWWSHVGWILALDYNQTNWQAVRDCSRYPELRWLNRKHGLGREPSQEVTNGYHSASFCPVSL